MIYVLVKILISEPWLFGRTVARRVQMIESKNHVWIHSGKVKPCNGITNGTSPNKVACACAQLKVTPLSFPRNRFLTTWQLLWDSKENAKGRPAYSTPRLSTGGYPKHVAAGVQSADVGYNRPHFKALVVEAQKGYVNYPKSQSWQGEVSVKL